MRPFSFSPGGTSVHSLSSFMCILYACVHAQLLYVHTVDYPVMHAECLVGREGERMEESSWHATLGVVTSRKLGEAFFNGNRQVL